VTLPSPRRLAFNLHPPLTTANRSWKVQYTKPTPSATGTLSLDVDIHGYVTLAAAAELSIIDKKYEAGVALLAPEFKGDLDAVVNTAGGVCSDPAKKAGLQAKVTAGATAYGYVGKNYLKPDKKFELFREDVSLLDQCFGF
jgi:hypothetical protein